MPARLLRSEKMKTRILACLFVFTLCAQAREPQTAPPKTPAVRARALGIPFDGTPGELNAITDVAGVEVGFTTLISGEGKLRVEKSLVPAKSAQQVRQNKHDAPDGGGETHDLSAEASSGQNFFQQDKKGQTSNPPDAHNAAEK